MDLKNENITWVKRKRYKFAGPIINAENRNAFKEKYFEEFIQSQPEENRKDVQILELAKKYAKDRVNRERKHYRAYLKGKNSYKFKGETYHVMDEDRFNRFRDELIRMDQMAKAEQARKAAEQEEE